MKKTFAQWIFYGLSLLLVLEIGVLFWQQKSHVFQVNAVKCDQADTVALKACWEQVINESIKRGDIAGAFDSLASLYEQNPSLGETCHSLTHEIGTSAYQFFARGKKVEITSKTAYCSYGFYHGFMEALVAAKKDMTLAHKFCVDVDTQLKTISPDAALQCYHGIGHGTVNNHDPRTWGKEQAMIDPALALCEEAATTEDELSRCATGVYNGISVFYENREYQLEVDPADPFRICREQKKLYQDACYISLNTLVLSLTDYDLVRATRFLDGVVDDTIAAHTMINLAAPVGSRHINEKDHMPVVSVCRSLAGRLRLPCIQGYAFGFLEHGEPQKEYIKSLAVCSIEYLSLEEKNACFEYILLYLPQWYGKEKVTSICTTVPQAYQNRCQEIVQTMP